MEESSNKNQKQDSSLKSKLKERKHKHIKSDSYQQNSSTSTLKKTPKVSLEFDEDPSSPQEIQTEHSDKMRYDANSSLDWSNHDMHHCEASLGHESSEKCTKSLLALETQEDDSRKVFFSGLSFAVAEEELRGIVEQFGPVEFCLLIFSFLRY